MAGSVFKRPVADGVKRGHQMLRPKSTSNVLNSGRRRLFNWVLQYQIRVSMTLIIGMAAMHKFFPRIRPHTRKFFFLSYASPTDHGTIHKQGIDDICFVSAWVVLFTAIRAITVEWLLQSLAGILGVAKRNQLRFAEQGWIFLYYSSIWSLGMFLWHDSEYWLNYANIWTSWPSREMTGLFKWYYLLQLSFTAQLLLAIHMEARRKDYLEMLTHHVITLSLISITYTYRYTRAANVVLCLMDFVDILLPFAKLLRYLRYETACNIAFGVFVVSWFITRHILYLHFSWNIYQHIPGENTMLFGCYNGATNERIQDMPSQPDYFSHLFWPFQDLDGVICLNSEVKYIFLGMLLLLHTLSAIWFVMILKVIAGILSGKSAEDIRSEDEGEHPKDFSIDSCNPCTGAGSELVGQDPETYMVAPRVVRDIETPDHITIIGSDASGLRTVASRSSRAPKSTAARTRLMGVEHRKELLNRIGCEKQIGE